MKLFAYRNPDPATRMLDSHLKGEAAGLPRNGNWSISGVQITEADPTVYLLAYFQAVRIDDGRTYKIDEHEIVVSAGP